MSEISSGRDLGMEQVSSSPKERKDSSQVREDLLDRDVSKLEKKDLARYLIALIQEVNTVKEGNKEKLWTLWQKIPWLQQRFQTLIEHWKTSEKTRWLMEQLNIALQELKQSLETNVPIEYERLQHELTESQIDDATQKMEWLLWHDASVITIWVGKYEQAWADNLQGTINDVHTVNTKLDEYNSPRHTTLIDEAATKKGILDAIKNTPADKWLFLYFAGHGAKWHIFPYSSNPLVENEEIHFESLISPRELFDAIGKREAMVIVDKCYGGDLTLTAPQNITIISSTDSETSAQENNKWGSRAVGVRKSRNEISTGPENTWIRWEATYGMTNSGERWLDLHWFVNSADQKHQNPTIKS